MRALRVAGEAESDFTLGVGTVAGLSARAREVPPVSAGLLQVRADQPGRLENLPRLRNESQNRTVRRAPAGDDGCSEHDSAGRTDPCGRCIASATLRRLTGSSGSANARRSSRIACSTRLASMNCTASTSALMRRAYEVACRVPESSRRAGSTFVAHRASDHATAIARLPWCAGPTATCSTRDAPRPPRRRSTIIRCATGS